MERHERDWIRAARASLHVQERITRPFALVASVPLEEHECDELCESTKRKDPADWYEAGVWVGPKGMGDAL